MIDTKLTERVEGQPDLTVDEATNTIRGVRIINRTSKNGRVYSDKALHDIAEKLDGARAYIDHIEPGKRGKGRSLREVCGVFSNPQVHADHVTADIGVSAKEDWMLEDAKKNPSLICFSISAQGAVNTKQKPNIVESVSALASVDAVTQGATTNGLFEGQESDTEDDRMDFSKLTLTELREQRPDIADAIEKAATADTAKDKELTEATQKVADVTAQLEEATAKNDEHEAAQAVALRRVLITEKLTESKLPEEAITDHFRESLEGMDAEKIDAAIADRKALVESAVVHDGGGSIRKTGGNGSTDTKSLLAECMV